MKTHRDKIGTSGKAICRASLKSAKDASFINDSNSHYKLRHEL